MVPDQIGFDKSSEPEIRYSSAVLADSNEHLLDHLTVDRVAIAADSISGMLGAHFAWCNPDRVAALVLINSQVSCSQAIAAGIVGPTGIFSRSAGAGEAVDGIVDILFLRYCSEKVPE